jgi:hypothetical protein
MDSSHPRYPKLCVECGNLNEQKRLARHDLTSYVALVTGGRIKIGYHTALRLLREGARVIVTTRFPYDAIRRYIQEPDWEDWKDRIHVYGLDFRRIDLVESFAFSLNQQFPYIDIISITQPRRSGCRMKCTKPCCKKKGNGKRNGWVPAKSREGSCRFMHLRKGRHRMMRKTFSCPWPARPGIRPIFLHLPTMLGLPNRIRSH